MENIWKLYQVFKNSNPCHLPCFPITSPQVLATIISYLMPQSPSWALCSQHCLPPHCTEMCPCDYIWAGKIYTEVLRWDFREAFLGMEQTAKTSLFCLPANLASTWDVDTMAGTPASILKTEFQMCKMTCVQEYLLEHYS